MFDGLCDSANDSVGGVGDVNWFAPRFKYKLEMAPHIASQKQQDLLTAAAASVLLFSSPRVACIIQLQSQ